MIGSQVCDIAEPKTPRLDYGIPLLTFQSLVQWQLRHFS